MTSVGSPLYLAPETAASALMCSLASDVYSASLVAVEMVTGSTVHSELTWERIAERADRLSTVAKVCVG
jgi:hypothetical protein